MPVWTASMSVRSVEPDAGFDGVDEREQRRARDGGNRHHEGKLDGKIAVESARHAGGDRAAGAGDARDCGDTLAQADDERVLHGHVALGASALRHTVRDEENAAREDEKQADGNRVVVKLLHLVLDRKDEHERERGKDDEQHEARHRERTTVRALAGAQSLALEEPDQLAHHLHDVAPIDDEDGNERAEVEHDVKEQMALLRGGHVKQILQHGQMSGAGDGQKLCNALHQTENDCIQNGHWIIPPKTAISRDRIYIM